MIRLPDIGIARRESSPSNCYVFSGVNGGVKVDFKLCLVPSSLLCIASSVRAIKSFRPKVAASSKLQIFQTVPKSYISFHNHFKGFRISFLLLNIFAICRSEVGLHGEVDTPAYETSFLKR